jgi:hypothetical protein
MNMPNSRCPRCGKPLPPLPPCPPSRPPNSGCASPPPTAGLPICPAPVAIASELYGFKNAMGANTNVCCSCREGCAIYPKSMRNLYWPHFAHPRWLSCAALYSGRC